MEVFGQADSMESSDLTVLSNYQQSYATKRYDVDAVSFAIWKISNEKHTKSLSTRAGRIHIVQSLPSMGKSCDQSKCTKKTKA